MGTYVVDKEGNLRALYAEEIHRFTSIVGTPPTLARASHIDPITAPSVREWLSPFQLRTNIRRRQFVRKHGTGYFGIFWLGEFHRWGVDFYDKRGKCFSSKATAESFELHRLRVEYLGLKDSHD